MTSHPEFGLLGRPGLPPPPEPGRVRAAPETAVSVPVPPAGCWHCGGRVDDRFRCVTARCPLFGRPPGAW